MHGQGNYGAAPRQDPYTNTPFHQRPPGPPPPPPSISQGLIPMVQQGRPPIQMYPNASTGLPQQGPINSVLSNVINNQPYLTAPPPHPPPGVHSTSQMQQHSHWTPNASYASPAGLPSAPRVLLPPPHPQASRFYTSPQGGSFEHVMPLSRNDPTGPPPPPPPSSLPGSAPFPRSSSSSHSPNTNVKTTALSASEPAFHPNVSHEMAASSPVGDGGKGAIANENLPTDLPTAPPKPADDRIARKIEVLCQFIARNGPEFENMTRLRESANPEFKFLFGGEPGTEAAVAHEYFLWAKRKSYLESLGRVVSSNAPLRQSEDFLSQQGTTTGGGVPGSPADSDMDMEDDITHPLEESPSSSSVKQSHETISLSNGIEKEQQLQSFDATAEPVIVTGAVEENLTYSRYSESGSRDPRQNEDESVMGKSFEVLDSVSSKDAGAPANLNTSATLHEVLSKASTPAELGEIRVEKHPNLPSKQGSSPFRLLPDYPSDEGSGDEDHRVDSMPATSVPSVAVDSTSHRPDDGFNLGTNRGADGVLEPEGLQYLAQSSKYHLKSKDEGVEQVSNLEKKKDAKTSCSTLKVDEFGRLIREGDSDSDRDGSPRYSRRKRSRSRSRSRSQDRRRRRSPRRRNERRGRSRSFSPRRRRSRSKSPPSRHGGETTRRDRRPECFDFLKGKCYRGASCRYSHHEEKSDRSRSNRSNRQQFEDSLKSTSAVQERLEMRYKKSSSAINQSSRNEELRCVDALPFTEEKKDTVETDGSTATAHSLGKSSDFEHSVRLADGCLENADVKSSAIDESKLQQSQNQLSEQFPPNADHHYQYTNASKSAAVDMQSPVTVHPVADNTHLKNETAINPSCTSSFSGRKHFGPVNSLTQSVVPMEPVLPATNYLSDIPAPFPSVASVSSSSCNQETPRDSNLALPASNFPHQVSYAHSHFSFPSNQSWNSVLPPPPPPHLPGPTYLAPRLHNGAVPVQFTQNMSQPPTNDYYSQTSARPYLPGFPHPSNVGQNQGGPGKAGPGTYPSSSYGQERLLSQPMRFSEDSGLNRQSFPGENRPTPDEISQPLPQPSYAVELPAASSVSALHGENIKQNSILPSEFKGNQSSMLSNLGVSRIPDHFNPYASTFEQPLSLKLSSNVSVQEDQKPFIGSAPETASSEIPADGRAVTGLGSFQPAEGALLNTGDDSYDPLFDSMEPSSNLVRNSLHGKTLEITDDSDGMLRFSGSNKPLDGREKKQKVGGPSDASGSLENDEFGETADAEVGAVENGSPSNPLDPADDGVGEIEIDQVKSPGKSKRTKESRSMRLFKIAIANFVKEVLKPSWRQGNMSKEAFKTIVKKTVDRVSGAMKSHQIPKSQAKINHYIDSSQRKLTKLVMGYVDKYVKV
ncbi:OLC1v1012026C1 [Oldenlandia corymbosa var. corymbosa]|uniref:OLC1v1012026C1 n=1 Tax=Oldenlandia corymbosa var. corymbosa TaxID=529605 RepID=A0AAV1DV59_OLDCO|nr:OLC1v1012026C1 [Oldenlandia corymbosa var. corymbosa]